MFYHRYCQKTQNKPEIVTMECKYTLVLVLVALFARQATAAQHVVGGSQGWDASTDLKSWASAQKFKVGDQLVFKYTPGLHSVVELGTDTEYKKCDTSSTLDSLSTGNDVVKLTKPGTRYFTCGTMGHCGQGMKMKVTVESAGSGSTTPDSSSSTPSSSTSGSTSTTPDSSGSAIHLFAFSGLVFGSLVAAALVPVV